ncbi:MULTISPECIES: isoprenylcysteine carboxylmethyltransferase family protein [unclassified Streptomyces]|uniref:methyltransferase family protein n=1 Tax=unclassified Streptomyces TaxID=2593676 RepID=UPI0034003EAE
MRRTTAAAGSALFFVLTPGTVAGLLPWWLTGWRQGEAYPMPVRWAGALLLAVGGAVLLHAFARFVVEGLGTPAPVAPTERLVVGGLYRYVRNPMYLAVLAAIAGEALLLSRPVLLAYGAAVAVAVTAFVHWYEEPALARRYGARYEAYRRSVRAWLPHATRRF